MREQNVRRKVAISQSQAITQENHNPVKITGFCSTKAYSGFLYEKQLWKTETT